MQNNLTPAFFGLPNELNQLAPRLVIVGTTDTVSTFVTVVGQPYSLALAGSGGFNIERPGLPHEIQ